MDHHWGIKEILSVLTEFTIYISHIIPKFAKQMPLHQQNSRSLPLGSHGSSSGLGMSSPRRLLKLCRGGGGDAFYLVKYLRKGTFLVKNESCDFLFFFFALEKTTVL